MIVLVSYGLVLQLFSCLVLHIRDIYFKGSIVAMSDHPVGHHESDYNARASV